MSTLKRAWDFLSDEQRRTVIDEIIGYFATEKNETIGVVAAENILDFFLQSAGNAIYNKALDDIKPFLASELESTLLNIDISLRKAEMKKTPKKTA
ncbi:MAG: hypothetical protein A3A28_01585 [Candidatus Sungbacteria bacterium RIFCSPLOWO2_01_FULL_47_32]|uniref:DUF2164 domain-containing protein n=1 Tax=Candidatus Sungbacteria bacterium RIFCSPHIGHO2_01_FULL_47_32 TaxID=1802264 RepID=A0A1G2K317_9BACT|nr:MAG: hypothetical protein UX72_C0030G0021 [Parcubacteria group bacterium GW2011_GWA2_47_10]OGZ93814.1 MAG: hypothetical protein A2633_05055 [Candidatus Sungbacteria bacterium RIFCSPHIGHO2_01_FULL_47_32]OGZ99668.1 MAG: hypothetical protein A3D57_04270 [Candidatus Sungbacteria bacterium RIFCSPHIGHO2_02_FULL_46_12]OHA05712.1 MAG: hypothetical protein A3A28_01585 [Candidatus Sungbacteria bacterium RIFCSPLOWO2_01_FULL_47_32]